MFFENLKTLKSSSDALDELYGADRHRVVEAVLKNSFEKGSLQATKVVAQSIASQNVQKLSTDPYNLFLVGGLGGPQNPPAFLGGSAPQSPHP